MEIHLPEFYIKKLQQLPESGMGYQVVDIKLKDGQVLTKLTVLNSSVLLFEGYLEVREIEEIKLSDNGT
ncbi:MAG: hypothetical protein PHV53_10420 [Fermentimonas sp.]|nr:hypothetical protein [Fermentimonas sp.]